MKKRPVCMLLLLAVVCMTVFSSHIAFSENIAFSDSFSQVGSIITFGCYPQTETGDDETPIEWQVLDYDPQGNKVLLISRFALDGKKYNEEYTTATWETCTLRDWLNNDFLNLAFTKEEQEQILVTTVDNAFEVTDIKCPDTQDKVFILSTKEAMSYFMPKDEESYLQLLGNLRCYPTEYAKKQGIYVYNNTKRFGRNKGDSDSLGAISWWLRSPALITMQAFFVLHSGDFPHKEDVNANRIAVRPAIWISLSTDKD